MARVLVIEDEPFIALMISEWLCEQGHSVVGTAATCDQALRLIASECPDFATVDYGLADDDARRAIAELKRRQTPFLLISATNPEVDDELSGIEQISKPVEFDRLGMALDRLSAPTGVAA